MPNYQHLELSQLVELLTDHTALYSKMRSMGFTEQDFKTCKEAMIELQIEIENRKRLSGNSTTLSSPDIFFEKTD
jgi:hypothetical protein